MEVKQGQQNFVKEYRQPDPLNEHNPSCVISEFKSTIHDTENTTEDTKKADNPKIERRQSHLSPRVRIMRCRDLQENRLKKSLISSHASRSDRFVAIQPAISIALKPENVIVRSSVHPAKEMREKVIPSKPRITPLEKKYVCDQCGWSFRDLSNMKDHALRHSGVKKFECDDCGHKFFTRPLLMLHVRVHHKGEKPFVCKYCGMGFRNSPSRCRHERYLFGYLFIDITYKIRMLMLILENTMRVSCLMSVINATEHSSVKLDWINTKFFIQREKRFTGTSFL